MIFSPQLAKKVLDSTKTVTRRRTEHRDGRPIRYTAAGVYAVQPGRGKRHVGHIVVTHAGLEPLQAITEEEARLEGFSGWPEFLDYWMKLHGSWNPGEIVARIAFRRIHRCDGCVPLEIPA